MQSVKNDKAVSHSSHIRLEDADEARVSHIPTTTATRLDKKDKQQQLLHQGIGLVSSTENAGRVASENATCRYLVRESSFSRLSTLAKYRTSSCVRVAKSRSENSAVTNS